MNHTLRDSGSVSVRHLLMNTFFFLLRINVCQMNQIESVFKYNFVISNICISLSLCAA